MLNRIFVAYNCSRCDENELDDDYQKYTHYHNDQCMPKFELLQIDFDFYNIFIENSHTIYHKYTSYRCPDSFDIFDMKSNSKYNVIKSYESINDENDYNNNRTYINEHPNGLLVIVMPLDNNLIKEFIYLPIDNKKISYKFLYSEEDAKKKLDNFNEIYVYKISFKELKIIYQYKFNNK